MRAIMTALFAVALAFSLTACGCSNSAMGDTQAPNTTILPDILPTIETNIPDPEVDTQMPIYTEDSNATTETSDPIPTETVK